MLHHQVPLTIAEKGADAFANARAKGMIRQFKEEKFYFVWRGHEPTERHGYTTRAWFTTRGDEWGYPLPHLVYYLFRPYLIGANYYVNEGIPGFCMQDIEGDKQYELSTLGYIYKDMLDFVDRHPERGIAYSPIALLLDNNRAFPQSGSSYSGYNLPYDYADQMNHGVLNNLLFPEHRDTRYTGGYSRTAPYGEIFDILKPNLQDSPINLKALENYKILFSLGGLKINKTFANKLIKYVEGGGALVINAEDIGTYFPVNFLGVKVYPDTFQAEEVICNLCGKSFSENPFTSYALKLYGANSIMTAKGWPIITKNKYGKGYVIVVGTHYMIQNNFIETDEGRTHRNWKKKPLLNFVSHFFNHLVVGVTPIEVLHKEEDKPDISWIINKKGDGWVVTIFNYSLKKESLVSKPVSTAKVIAEYPYKEIPFKIVCRAPVKDIVEWYKDRDVNWEKEGNNAVISETIHGGEIRVYELQPHKIDLGTRERYKNYALNKQVKASSHLKGYPPANAIDGNYDNENFWWSDTDPRRHYIFDMPQWLQVDLGGIKTIDRIFILFHCWKHESLKTRLRIYKYIIEASADGKIWKRVIDESKNEDNARLQGIERWFSPVKARYIKLTVLRNSAFGGARVVEMKVMGKEKETYHPKRSSIIEGNGDI